MLQTAVLVLNRNYQAVQVTTARRAFCLLFRGAAEAVGHDFRTFSFNAWVELGAAAHHEVVHTPRWVVRVPRVILLLTFERLPRTSVRFSRGNVFLRDKYTCQYCGRTLPRSKLNLDHVVPRAQGGRTTWDNVVCSCIRCNRRKGGRSPQQAGLRLLRRPVRPRWSPTFRLQVGAYYQE